MEQNDSPQSACFTKDKWEYNSQVILLVIKAV